MVLDVQNTVNCYRSPGTFCGLFDDFSSGDVCRMSERATMCDKRVLGPLTVCCAYRPLWRWFVHSYPLTEFCDIRPPWQCRVHPTPPLPLTVCCGSDPANRYARNSFSLSHMTSQGHFKTKSWIWIFYFDLLSVLDRIHLKTSVPLVCLVFISNSFVTLFTIQRWSRSLDWTWNPRTN